MPLPTDRKHPLYLALKTITRPQCRYEYRQGRDPKLAILEWWTKERPGLRFIVEDGETRIETEDQP